MVNEKLKEIIEKLEKEVEKVYKEKLSKKYKIDVKKEEVVKKALVLMLLRVGLDRALMKWKEKKQ